MLSESATGRTYRTVTIARLNALSGRDVARSTIRPSAVNHSVAASQQWLPNATS